MKLVFLGPPGAGKGTIASEAADIFNIPHISTGQLFRNAIQNMTELGKKVKPILDSGDLVPDELTIELLKERISQNDAQNGFILDGFPRTINQAEELAKVEPEIQVVNFEVPDEVIIKRLSGRRVCSKCGETYHVDYMPPKTPGVCDKCGGQLITRDDDKEESIRNRLEVYKEKTFPLIDYYKKQGGLLSIDANKKPEEVVKELQKALSAS
ncbi:MAG: adenylate kinase [Spirochaetia bacterium]